LRACVISTLVSFAAVGIPHSAGQRRLTLLVISCFAAWRTRLQADLGWWKKEDNASNERINATVATPPLQLRR
jgi:hypothetical protein